MSAREVGYMTNEDFDLPRWQTGADHHAAALSSSHQAAQAVQGAHGGYMYSPPASHSTGPPPPAALLAGGGGGGASRHNTGASVGSINSVGSGGHGGSQGGAPPQSPNHAASARQARLNQLLDGSAHLSRSASYASSLGPRGQQQHQQHQQPPRRRAHDDFEGALEDDADMAGPQQSPYAGGGGGPSFYAAQIGHHAAPPSAPPSGGGGGDVFGDGPGYFAQGQAPRRAATHRDPATTSRALGAALSPGGGGGGAPQPPYSPGGNAYTGYPAEHRGGMRTGPSTPYSHSRAQSRVQGDAYGGYGGAMDVSGSPSQGQHLSAQHAHGLSASTPSSPLHHGFGGLAPTPGFYDPHAMVVETPPQPYASPARRPEGFRRIKDARELRPRVTPNLQNRRMDHMSGEFLAPLKQLTTGLVDTYRLCNHGFRYESSHNPRRVLTKPNKPSHNDGYDNEDYDYILYVNDVLGSDEKDRYVILDILGQGTFGQVVKCQNIKTHEILAVKVVKNKPAYFNQSMMEVTILEMLNKDLDPKDEHHILRLRDSFIHKQHLCLVFELLASNLYELIKQNQFQGLSIQLVKVFTSQLLDALTVLKDARLIHCDLKPENILLKSMQSPQIKVIDFGSACHERQTVYTYIQSRFYRSPEVLLGMPYTAAIDIWSLGCIAVELFLGLPLFPGTSEYNQITRIVEMLGLPPQHMLDRGKQTTQFFNSFSDHFGAKKYELKGLEQYSREHNTNEQPGKQYFNGKTMPEIINNTQMPVFKSSKHHQETEKELLNRQCFIDFCQGLLNMDPVHRWSPQQARMHPFITGEKWSKPWQPMTQGASPAQSQQQTPAPSPAAADPKRPYGGLVQTQPQKGARAYPDAATYNQQLMQQQAYTAQQAAATQAANNALRNPYLTSGSGPLPPQVPSAASYSSPEKPANTYVSSTHSGQQYTQQQQQQQQQPQHSQQPAAGGYRTLSHQSSHGNLNVNTSVSGFQSMPSANTGGGGGQQPYLNPNPPANVYQSGGTRQRSNTINKIDNIPPALARLQHMNHDVIGGRNALTPVMNRDADPYQEWERRRTGKVPASVPYPQLEFLHQQAELAAQQGMGVWTGGHGHAQAHGQHRYPAQGSKLSHSYQPSQGQGSILVDNDRRDAVMSNVRSAARGDGGAGGLYASASGSAITSPPQVYSGNPAAGANRFPTTFSAQATQGPMGGFGEAPGGGVGGLYQPMQPDQFQPYTSAGGAGAAARHIVPPAQAFYGPGVVPNQGQNGGQGTPMMQGGGGGQPMGAGGAKDQRRGSGNPVDLWPR